MPSRPRFPSIVHPIASEGSPFLSFFHPDRLRLPRKTLVLPPGYERTRKCHISSDFLYASPPTSLLRPVGFSAASYPAGDTRGDIVTDMATFCSAAEVRLHRPARAGEPPGTAGSHFRGLGKKTVQICRREKLSVSDLESSSLAGFCALIWSNLCTRDIPDKLTPRGHHDWPDNGVLRPSAADWAADRLLQWTRL